jgi:hypothetical protein
LKINSRKANTVPMPPHTRHMRAFIFDATILHKLGRTIRQQKLPWSHLYEHRGARPSCSAEPAFQPSWIPPFKVGPCELWSRVVRHEAPNRSSQLGSMGRCNANSPVPNEYDQCDTSRMRWFGGVFEATILTRGGLLSLPDFEHHLSALLHSRFPLNVGSQSCAGSCNTKP